MNKIVVYRTTTKPKGSGHRLAQALNAPSCASGILPKNTGFDEPITIVNYGYSAIPQWLSMMDEYEVINHWDAIRLSVDKRLTFQALNDNDVPCLEYTVSKDTAQSWCDDGYHVIARTEVAASKGKGIVVVEPYTSVPEAELYTAWYDKTDEHRVHVFRGEVIAVQQKVPMHEDYLEEKNFTYNDDICNYHNGWIFASKHSHPDMFRYDKKIGTVAINATKALGLDYCGVDVLSIWTGTGKCKEAVVCESNTAPALGTPFVLEAYTKAILESIK